MQLFHYGYNLEAYIVQTMEIGLSINMKNEKLLD